MSEVASEAIAFQERLTNLTGAMIQASGDTSRRIAFVARVKVDRLEEYKEHHKKVWPEMLDALRNAGWRNYSLFLKEDDGTLFGYFEGPDGLTFEEARERMAATDINSKWQEFMAPFFEPLGGTRGRPDLMLQELQHVFYLA